MEMTPTLEFIAGAYWTDRERKEFEGAVQKCFDHQAFFAGNAFYSPIKGSNEGLETAHLQTLFNQGLTLPTRGLRYGFQGIVNAKNLRENSFSPSDGGLASSDREAIAPSNPPLAPPLYLISIR